METTTKVDHSYDIRRQAEIHSSPCRLRMTTNPEKNTAMNLVNKYLRNIETKNSLPEPPNTKAHGGFRSVIVITGAALCMGLASCVVPYDGQSTGSVTVSSYSPGYRVNTLPGGYRSELISGSTYYYHDGYYYRQGSGGYVVVDAPRSSRYYGDYSSRHQSNQPNRDYRGSSNRQGPQYGSDEVITRLPDGYRELNHRGDTYYQAGDRYYRRQGETYVITTRPY